MAPEHRHPRRRERSQDEEWIRSLLHRGETAVLAAVLDGAPFCLPRIYVYDQKREAVYMHGAYGGETGKVLDQGGPGTATPVALTVFEMGRLLPADEAVEFGVEYASVIVSGNALEVEDAEEKEHALELLMEKYAPHLKPGDDYRPMEPDEVLRTSVVRLDIEWWSGKGRAEPLDFAGAYRLADVRGRRSP